MIDLEALADYNEGIKRARREYAAHPFAEWTGVASKCFCVRCSHKRTYDRDYARLPEVRVRKAAYLRKWRAARKDAA